MITHATVQNEPGFSLDLNLFFIDSDLHGNLTLYTRDMAENQDLYMGFIFKHADENPEPVKLEDLELEPSNFTEDD